ncbi:SDR family NAD(P)-dependent oxidoreductase [Brevibacterium sp. 5221]|uniref:SDR family NAD(P)-dependent oxidoreductase n=1 Tax=Brevibacterium rongguiense TaxID=2695267 RepID=A0A6N9H4S0_9MICO|nr:SDR family NAD(P)-dependent oxidoreductase [Brevibacterium rongguiense]MYM18766.1 SDR family NAD(P)-dependent oxidoreductase [Brevibacterium rongguiense]
MDTAPKDTEPLDTAAPRETAPRALITGSTSGIGAAFAAQLAQEGYDLVLVARGAQRLEAQAAQLRERWGIGASAVPADLATEAGIAAVAEVIDAERIDVLVNNAGYGLASSALETPVAELAAMSTVLLRAVQVLSWHAARRMLDRGRGGIVTVTSLAALTTMGEYAADKAAATVFTESLAAELAGTPVTATAVLPGFVATQFHAAMGAQRPAFPRLAWLRPEQVAREALAAARRGAVTCVPGAQYRVLAAVAPLVPRPLVRWASAGFGFDRAARAAPVS